MAAALPAVVDYASSDDEDSHVPVSQAAADAGPAVADESRPSASRMIRGAGAFVQAAPEPVLSLAVRAGPRRGWCAGVQPVWCCHGWWGAGTSGGTFRRGASHVSPWNAAWANACTPRARLQHLALAPCSCAVLFALQARGGTRVDAPMAGPVLPGPIGSLGVGKARPGVTTVASGATMEVSDAQPAASEFSRPAR